MAPTAVEPCPVLAHLMEETQEEVGEGMATASDLIMLPLVAYEEFFSEQCVWHCTVLTYLGIPFGQHTTVATN